MRPQHITAENDKQKMKYHHNHNASMRPQHITAENAEESALIVHRQLLQ